MALLTAAKILQKILNKKQLIPFVIHSLTQSSSRFLSSSPLQTRHFSQSFHRTPLVHSYHLPQDPCFYPTLDKVIDFTEFFDKSSQNSQKGIGKLVDAIKKADGLSVEETVDYLEKSGVEPNEELVFGAVGVLRDKWELALFVFKWGEKRGCLGENVWALMIWVLGNCKKFSTAWCLIKDMHQSSVDTRRAMLVMIDRYSAANDPSQAIHTFEIMENFNTTPDIESFHILLSSLCKSGNMEKAEEFMLSSKRLFPLETDSYNIILYGWCYIQVDVLEAKRIWREMAKCCILPNESSFTNMISCFSKVGNLFDALRLYDEMKKKGWAPGLEVYNSLVYVLTRENCLEQAMKILEKMKVEGVKPNSSTYNSMIGPLCEALKLDEARNILVTMIDNKIDPSIETYHSFITGASEDETTEILNHMKKAGLGPIKDSFLIIFRKFFKLKQPENALKFLDEMKRFEIEVDYEHYIVLVEGLMSCGLLIKAREVYDEMKVNGFVDDPKLKKLLSSPETINKYIAEKVSFRVARAIDKDTQLRPKKSSEVRRGKRGKKAR